MKRLGAVCVFKLLGLRDILSCEFDGTILCPVTIIVVRHCDETTMPSVARYND